MRILGLVVALLTPALLAGEAGDPNVRGRLQAKAVEGTDGELTLRTGNLLVWSIRVDAGTRYEWRAKEVSVAETRPGDFLEIEYESDPRKRAGRGKVVRILEAPWEKRLAEAARLPWLYRSPTERFAPRGALTFTGVVLRVSDDRLVLLTRKREELVITLRHDTQFAGDGVRVARSELQPNKLVYVRGGRNIDQEIEAYQVVWGKILRPE